VRSSAISLFSDIFILSVRSTQALREEHKS